MVFEMNGDEDYINDEDYLQPSLGVVLKINSKSETLHAYWYLRINPSTVRPPQL